VVRVSWPEHPGLQKKKRERERVQFVLVFNKVSLPSTYIYIGLMFTCLNKIQNLYHYIKGCKVIMNDGLHM
jgi:hypothetical protein